VLRAAEPGKSRTHTLKRGKGKTSSKEIGRALNHGSARAGSAPNEFQNIPFPELKGEKVMFRVKKPSPSGLGCLVAVGAWAHTHTALATNKCCGLHAALCAQAAVGARSSAALRAHSHNRAVFDLRAELFLRECHLQLTPYEKEGLFSSYTQL
jgi:hypothetical protein